MHASWQVLRKNWVAADLNDGAKSMNPELIDIYSDSRTRLKLGLCQVRTEAWDVDGNFQRTQEALEAAAAQGAELAITPECVFHGYGFGENQEDTKRRLAKVAEPVDGPRVTAIRQLSQRKKMAIVLGFAERGARGLFHNSAAVISAQGEILDVYRKVHCRSFEQIAHTGAFTPGDRFVAADMKLTFLSFRMGTMICFDREITESVRCLRAIGAQFIACPLACDTVCMDQNLDYAHNETITRCRAAENELFIAVINHAGRFNGGSFVVGPGGEKVVQLGAGPEVRTVELPVLALAAKIHSDPLGWMGWGYRRQDVYDRHLKPEPVKVASRKKTRAG